jgi:hypothetical protein
MCVCMCFIFYFIFFNFWVCLTLRSIIIWGWGLHPSQDKFCVLGCRRRTMRRFIFELPCVLLDEVSAKLDIKSLVRFINVAHSSKCDTVSPQWDTRVQVGKIQLERSVFFEIQEMITNNTAYHAYTLQPSDRLVPLRNLLEVLRTHNKVRYPPWIVEAMGGIREMYAIPVLDDVITLQGYSMYMDHILPVDVPYPVMRGVNTLKRPFVCFKFRTIGCRGESAQQVGTLLQISGGGWTYGTSGPVSGLYWKNSVDVDDVRLLADRMRRMVMGEFVGQGNQPRFPVSVDLMDRFLEVGIEGFSDVELSPEEHLSKGIRLVI